MGFVKKISIYVHMFICLSHPCAKYTNVLFTFYHCYRCYLPKCILLSKKENVQRFTKLHLLSINTTKYVIYNISLNERQSSYATLNLIGLTKKQPVRMIDIQILSSKSQCVVWKVVLSGSMLYLKDLKLTKYYLNTIYSYCYLANTIIKKNP